MDTEMHIGICRPRKPAERTALVTVLKKDEQRALHEGGATRRRGWSAGRR
jgi:hypothetical protein